MGMAESVKVEIKTRLDEHIRSNPNDFVGKSSVYIQQLERRNLKATLQIFFTMNYAGDQFERLIATRDAAYQIVSDVMGRCKGNSGVAHTAHHSVQLVGSAQHWSVTE
jgi:hypothetical protein